MVDDKAPTQTPIPLAAGPHTVAISAPLYVFYADTLDIKAGEELVFTPELTKLGEPMRPRQRILQRLGLGGDAGAHLRQAGAGLQPGQGLLGRPAGAGGAAPGADPGST